MFDVMIKINVSHFRNIFFITSAASEVNRKYLKLTKMHIIRFAMKLVNCSGKIPPPPPPPPPIPIISERD